MWTNSRAHFWHVKGPGFNTQYCRKGKNKTKPPIQNKTQNWHCSSCLSFQCKKLEQEDRNSQLAYYRRPYLKITPNQTKPNPNNPADTALLSWPPKWDCYNFQFLFISAALRTTVICMHLPANPSNCIFL